MNFYTDMLLLFCNIYKKKSIVNAAWNIIREMYKEITFTL